MIILINSSSVYGKAHIIHGYGFVIYSVKIVRETIESVDRLQDDIILKVVVGRF